MLGIGITPGPVDPLLSSNNCMSLLGIKKAAKLMLKRNCKANVDKVGMQIPIKLTKQVQLGGKDTSIRKAQAGPRVARESECAHAPAAQNVFQLGRKPVHMYSCEDLLVGKRRDV